MSDQGQTLAQQGWQKLSAGDLDGATEILTRAIMADDKDADAKALLGMAYSQKGLHPQAKRALQTAVEMVPGNADFHCNHGVVLERAGELVAAAAAYQAALQINPHHELSRQRLQAIGHAAPAPTPQPPFAQQSPPQAAPSHGQMPVFGSPVAQSSPWQPAPSAPTPVGASAAVPPQANKPGHVTCSRCGQETRQSLSCEWCSAPLRPPSPAQAPSGGPAAGAGHVPHAPMEASVAMASLHAHGSARRENQREWLQNVWLIRGGIGALSLAVSIGLGVFRSSMRSAARERRATTINLTVGGQPTQFKGATAVFDTTLGGQLYISAEDDADTTFVIGLPTQVSSPSQLGGQTLTSTNNMSEMQTFDPDDFPDVMMMDGRMFFGERVTANVSTATDKKITLTLDASFREIDLSGGQLKPPIPVSGTMTLNVTRD